MRWPVAIVAGLVLMGGCGEERSVGVSLEESAEQFRTAVDTVAERLGGATAVRQDEVGACDPSRTASGRQLAYVVAVRADEGTREELLGPVGERMRADGWRVSEGPGRTVGFAKDGMNVRVVIDPAAGVATVGGSSRCVEDG